MEEIWKDIEGYEGIYQVSNLGRVRPQNRDIVFKKGNKNRVVGDSMRASYDGGGYQSIVLWNDITHKTIHIHRLVAEAFLEPPPSPNMEVNHKDGNKCNNCIENLEWVTHAENMKHAFENLRFKRWKKCTLICADGSKKDFKSFAEAERFLGRKHPYIHDCLRDKRDALDRAKNAYKIIAEVI